ncbi:hypothetical protein BDB01DRAFT_896891 [Pilobolus umbonatus]|nr:hypothetical protein BDB01DRAFT_896891 [Pilobolus umbonatus]
MTSLGTICPCQFKEKLSGRRFLLLGRASATLLKLNTDIRNTLIRKNLPFHYPTDNPQRYIHLTLEGFLYFNCFIEGSIMNKRESLSAKVLNIAAQFLSHCKRPPRVHLRCMSKNLEVTSKFKKHVATTQNGTVSIFNVNILADKRKSDLGSSTFTKLLFTREYVDNEN